MHGDLVSGGVRLHHVVLELLLRHHHQSQVVLARIVQEGLGDGSGATYE
jgi:hypothetical protein